jgi:hypothetical protein
MKKALIREMVEQYLLQEVSIKKQKHPFKAILMTGPAGAGKSFTSKNLLGIPAEVRRFTLNPDEIIEDIFPRFGLPLNFIQDEDDPIGVAQQEMRKLAQIATKSKAAGYINRAKPLYFDTTGENPAKMIPVLEQLIELGYDVGIIKVSVPKQTSIGRDQKRDRTVGEEITDKIWSDYQKNVVEDKAYDQWAAGQTYAKVLNPDVFYNVYNLSDEDSYDKEGELIAYARSKVLDVKGDVNVSIEQMDTVIANLKKEVGDFLTPKDVPNPVGKDLYEGMKVLLKMSKGILGNELTDFYTVAIDAPIALENAAIKKAVDRIAEITDDADLDKSLLALAGRVGKAARGKAKGERARTAADIIATAKEAGAELTEAEKKLVKEVARRVIEKVKKK